MAVRAHSRLHITQTIRKTKSYIFGLLTYRSIKQRYTLREGWKRHPFAKHRQGQPGAKDTADSPAPVTIKYGEVRAVVVEQPGHAQNKKPSSLKKTVSIWCRSVKTRRPASKLINCYISI